MDISVQKARDDFCFPLRKSGDKSFRDCVRFSRRVILLRGERGSVVLHVAVPTRPKALLMLIGECMAAGAKTALLNGANGTQVPTRRNGILIHSARLLRLTVSSSRAIGQRALLAPINTLRLELLTGLATATAGRTAGAYLEDESEQGKGGSNPHEDEHLGADVGFDVDAWVGVCEDIGEDHEHDCRDRGAYDRH